MGKPGTQARRLRGVMDWKSLACSVCYMQGECTVSGKLCLLAVSPSQWLLRLDHRPSPVLSPGMVRLLSSSLIVTWTRPLNALHSGGRCVHWAWVVVHLDAELLQPQTQPGCSMPLSCFVLSVRFLTFFLTYSLMLKDQILLLKRKIYINLMEE